jgi:hypothetical protein
VQHIYTLLKLDFGNKFPSNNLIFKALGFYKKKNLLHNIKVIVLHFELEFTIFQPSGEKRITHFPAGKWLGEGNYKAQN